MRSEDHACSSRAHAPAAGITADPITIVSCRLSQKKYSPSSTFTEKTQTNGAVTRQLEEPVVPQLARSQRSHFQRNAAANAPFNLGVVLSPRNENTEGSCFCIKPLLPPSQSRLEGFGHSLPAGWHPVALGHTDPRRPLAPSSRQASAQALACVTPRIQSLELERSWHGLQISISKGISACISLYNSTAVSRLQPAPPRQGFTVQSREFWSRFFFPRYSSSAGTGSVLPSPCRARSTDRCERLLTSQCSAKIQSKTAKQAAFPPGSASWSKRTPNHPAGAPPVEHVLSPSLSRAAQEVEGTVKNNCCPSGVYLFARLYSRKINS